MENESRAKFKTKNIYIIADIQHKMEKTSINPKKKKEKKKENHGPQIL